ncbi:hypothetical protein CLIB1423_17S02410 [[Candida] railenensis]|uniref:NDT80 domain-containing protein n=1 Tax=[Candida] railenensis TaxID=45579 RepID=A0A9P0QS89_9ASCO|nr:hypothetical protein CLIB1423_17S02410 [[Candida] railenensis]
MMTISNDDLGYRKNGDDISPDDATTAAAVAAASSAAAAAAAAAGMGDMKDDDNEHDLNVHDAHDVAVLAQHNEHNNLLQQHALQQLQQSSQNSQNSQNHQNHQSLQSHQSHQPHQSHQGLQNSQSQQQHQQNSHQNIHNVHSAHLQQQQQQHQQQGQQQQGQQGQQQLSHSALSHMHSLQQQLHPQHHLLQQHLHHLPQLQQQSTSQQIHHLDMLHNEEDLLEAANRKVAPRSSDLFRVGPSFSETRHHQDIYCKKNDMDVNPILEARIDRGFETGENGTWIGYKRNYFTLVASFSLENFDFNRFIQNKFYTYEKVSSVIKDGESIEKKVEISYFAIRLVAKCSDDEVAISLVQHTAKRDKGPQFPPPIYPAVPGDMPDHETVRASCNKRNGNKIENMNKVFYFDRAEYYQHTNLDTIKDDSVLKNYPSDSIARVARFERIQFTSSIRLKSTSVNSRYFTLHVELLGIIEDEDSQIQPILLSSIETPPLIIRGRSPSNYHKDRTSGYRPHLHHH